MAAVSVLMGLDPGRLFGRTDRILQGHQRTVCWAGSSLFNGRGLSVPGVNARGESKERNCGLGGRERRVGSADK